MATKERLIIETLFMIANKDNKDVPFILNETQATLDGNLCGRDIIPKARQEGVSAYFLARYTAKCLSIRNTRAVIISHETKATQRMLGRVHYYLDNIRCPAPVISNASKNELTFPKTNSTFYIGTAGAKAFGRGDTISDLHCSEFAYWDHPKDLLAGLLQAVPKNGEVAIESTGNGKGNQYHRFCMNALAGKGRFRLHFFGWLDCGEYTYDFGEAESVKFLQSLDVDLEEDRLIKIPGITAGRLAWRRDVLADMDYDLPKFAQEYPITLDECFQASGHSLFNKINYQPTSDWVRLDRNMWQLEGHPRAGFSYVIGADVSAGVGQDASIAEIFCLNTWEQVGEWVSDRTEPDIFGKTILPRLGHEFNGAYIAVERNNHGILTLSELRANYEIHLIYKTNSNQKDPDQIKLLSNLGVVTSSRSKPFLVGVLRRELAGELIIHSPLLKDQLDTFIETEGGQLEAEEGQKDDAVMASAVGVYASTRAGLMLQESTPQHKTDPRLDPFSFEAIVSEMNKKRGGGFPIRSQTGWTQ